MAQLIFFRNMAETILPYTPGGLHTVKNAYELNGIAPKVTKYVTDSGGTQSRVIL